MAQAGLTFDKASHEYRLGGVVVPSVTTIVHSVIPGFQAEQRYLERGTRLHQLCQDFDDDFLDMNDVPAENLGRVHAWAKFRKDFPAKIIAVEKPMASERYLFAGTMDRGLSVRHARIVCDLKSTIEPRVRIQLSLYSLLWEETDGVKPDKAVAVELRATGEYRCLWMDRRELRLAEQTALGVLSTFNFLTTYLGRSSQ